MFKKRFMMETIMCWSLVHKGEEVIDHGRYVDEEDHPILVSSIGLVSPFINGINLESGDLRSWSRTSLGSMDIISALRTGGHHLAVENWGWTPNMCHFNIFNQIRCHVFSWYHYGKLFSMECHPNVERFFKENRNIMGMEISCVQNIPKQPNDQMVWLIGT